MRASLRARDKVPERVPTDRKSLPDMEPIMTTYLDIYAATRESKSTVTVTATRNAARGLNTETGVTALVNSIIANTR